MHSLSHILLFLGATTVMGHPWVPMPKATRRSIDLNSYRLSADTTYVNSGSLARRKIRRVARRSNYVETAESFVKETLPGLQFRTVDDFYVGSNGIAHVNFKQQAHGLDIDNADFNVNVSIQRHRLRHILGMA